MLRPILFLLWPILLTAEETLSLDRIVVIGASVSRGFTETEPFGGEKSHLLRFDRYLDKALTAPHGKISNEASHLFFTSVERQANSQLNRLSRRDPSLVVGIDFLFWFLYGHPEKVGDRLQLFDRGLDLLSTIEVPLIIGDIPDASAAIGHMLSRHMVPDAKIRAEANRRLTVWAAKRPHVSVVPLSEFVKSSEADVAIEVGEVTIPAGSTRRLLQRDRLHPTHPGCAALALAVMSALTDFGLSENQVLWNPEEILSEEPSATD
ncbi:hypothetical protein [Haloferula sp.]|uniref:hypothetical protein n=1 Tax=Haloferula sp. TaxID=2497595 RepID=UPI003C70B3EF